MQSPTASDPSFKAFLEKLQEQNTRGFATQLVQLKAEREIAGEDGDKREEQLDEVISSLKEVRNAVTGIKIDLDITPLVNIGENQTKLLDEIFKESSLTRKLTEGSVEYSKEMAGYRNTSGRDVINEVSGKVSKTGQVIDFETARDALSAQGKRAKEANAFDLKPINYVPGKAAAAAVGGKKDTSPDTDDDLEKTKYQGLFNEIKSGLKFFMTDGLSEKPGFGAYQEPPKEVEKKEREAKVSSPRQENPEGDNVITTGEIEADAAKSDLELSKQMLDTTKEQLTVLKEIRDALAPKTPRELTEQKGAPSSTTEKEKEEGGSSLLGDLASTAGDFIGTGKKTAGSIGGKLAKFATSNTGKVLGSVAAVGLGAYTAYEGYTAAEDSKQVKLEEVQAKVDAGQLSPEDAAAQRKDIGNSATVEKSGAIGEGTGMAAGAIAGASLGATIGSVVPGIGTAIGGIAGGALGAFAGSKAGKVVGEYGGKAINAAGDFFGGIGDKVKGAYNSGIGLNDQAKGVAMADQMVSSTGEVATNDASISQGPGLNVNKSERSLTKGITAEKSVLGSTFLGGLFTAKGKESGSFLGKDTKENEVTGKVEGRQINQTDTKYGTMLGKRISGGLLGKDTYKVSSEMSGTGEGSAEYDLEVSKGQYNELKELNKKGDVEGARKKLAEIKAKSAENAEALNIASPEEMVSGASPILKGKDVVQASTENKDMERDAKGRGGANNTVVSNNVSSNNTTKIVPMKANPRPEYTGSALDRYTSRIAVY